VLRELIERLNRRLQHDLVVPDAQLAVIWKILMTERTAMDHFIKSLGQHLLPTDLPDEE
jgi:hypothetical protein